MEPFSVGTNGSRGAHRRPRQPVRRVRAADPPDPGVGARARARRRRPRDERRPERPRRRACELVIALGGDGTILRALQLAMAHHAAVLGVNFGTVGFLADIDGDDLAAALDTIARGRGDGRRPHRARRDDARRRRGRTASSPSTTSSSRRIPGHGTARLRVEVGGEPMLALTGDGVVVASPTGSTAYTVGAGGPAVAPSLDAIVLTPLATQGSPLRSLVADGSDSVRIELAPSSAPVSVEIDGRTSLDMPAAAARRDPRRAAQGAPGAHAPAHVLRGPRRPALTRRPPRRRRGAAARARCPRPRVEHRDRLPGRAPLGTPCGASSSKSSLPRRAVVVRRLPPAVDRPPVVAEAPGVALGERQRREVGTVADELPHAVAQRHPVDAHDAARVEVVLHVLVAVAVLGDRDARRAARGVRVLGAGALRAGTGRRAPMRTTATRRSARA